LFLITAFIGFLIRYCIEMSFSFLSFFLVETGGIVDIFYFAMSLLSGSVIPLWFFPDWLEKLAIYMPFQGIYYIPTSIFIGKITGVEIAFSIATQIFWLLVCYGILRFVWHKASQKVVVQGG
jgi:ABC-2 type transport system permease protein